jgi:hypothetical protein
MSRNAGVAKLVDAPDLGSGAYGVGVQVPPPAPLNQKNFIFKAVTRIFFGFYIVHSLGIFSGASFP